MGSEADAGSGPIQPEPVSAFLERAAADSATFALVLSAAIGELDRRIQEQVSAILAAEPFRRLEAAWRSLAYLVDEAPDNDPDEPAVWIRVLDARRSELLEDFDDSIEFDRSALFQMVYEQEFGRLGGEPYALLVTDMDFSNTHEDVYLLRSLSEVAAAAHAVLLAGASPTLLGLKRWSELSLRTVRDPQDSSAFTDWKALRDTQDSRYVGLVLPRVLLRLPYRADDPDSLLRLREDAVRADDRLWGNGAFALAAVSIGAFHEFGWCTAIRGLQEGWGVVPGLPLEDVSTDRPGLVVRPPVDVAVIESQEKALAALGLIPLCRVSGAPQVAFFSLPSLHQPPASLDTDVTANLHLSCQLPYLLAASRFAHYLKQMMRDRIGVFSSRPQIEALFSKFLADYTLDDATAGLELRAQYPLRESEVRVQEKPDRPGHFEAVVQLRPHHQLQDPDVMLRLTVDLPGSEGGVS